MQGREGKFVEQKVEVCFGEGIVFYIKNLCLSLLLPGIRNLKLLLLNAAILRHLGGCIFQTGHGLGATGEVLLMEGF